MSILVTGATGTVGSLIVDRLATAGAEVKALVRTPGKASFPKGVTEVSGDLTVKSVVENHGVYPMPIGSAGVWMVDTRDIADVATTELLERDRAPGTLPRRTLDVVGPEAMSGESVARIWSEELKREIQYGGNDVEAFERQMATFTPAWMAYDMRLMMDRIQKIGMRPETGTVEALQKQLGRPLRTYRNLVREMINAKS